MKQLRTTVSLPADIVRTLEQRGDNRSFALARIVRRYSQLCEASLPQFNERQRDAIREAVGIVPDMPATLLKRHLADRLKRPLPGTPGDVVDSMAVLAGQLTDAQAIAIADALEAGAI